MSPADFRREHPDVFLLDPGDPPALEAHLAGLGWLGDGETVEAVASAGAGNMNCTVRVRTGCRSVIVKQSRPWVEKYPQFAAPWDRALTEAAFYRLTASAPAVAAGMPRLLGIDPDARLLLLEDLGTGGDLTGVYREPDLLGLEAIRGLGRWLGALHQRFPTPREGSSLANRGMRELNHAHVFRIPFEPENGLDLDAILPGLESVARAVLTPDVGAAAAELGRESYLADGPCLLHGDFFPGSFVNTPAGPRVIDPEFAFFGPPEWDAGVFLAHLVLAGASPEAHRTWWEAYTPPDAFQPRLTHRLAGVEILRRLFGYAQLPLTPDLGPRRIAAQLARDWILDPPQAPGVPLPTA